MKGHWLDAVARKAESRLPRRNLFLMASTAIGASLARPESALACKKEGKKCDKNKDCCDHAKCRGGNCTCKSGFDECGGSCVNLDNDDNHCGGCNNACDAGHSCLAGICTTPDGCPAGADGCAGTRIACADVTRCLCSRSTAGETICGDIHTEGAQCGQCETDADCASFGAGAFCVATGSESCCGPDAQNVCRLRCVAS